jgi:DNA invertase Pin-like site-specific DNA recombinase
MKRVAIYARVSTDKQTCENQLIELRAVAERCGYTIVTEFVDTGISGAKGRADRPALNEMMKAATQRRFDMVLVWSIDRLGRSLQNLVELLNELQSMRICWRRLNLDSECRFFLDRGLAANIWLVDC